VIFGLTLAHKKQHLSRAIMEGVTMVLRRMIDSTTELGVHVKEIISLSGGSKSDAWCQIKADATQTPVHTLRGAGSAACRGAALIAGVGIGLWDSAVPVARSAVEFDRYFQPQPENADAYDQLFDRYMTLQASLKPLLQPAGQAS
jgi:sugar (pentulose or hexulose) kinase